MCAGVCSIQGESHSSAALLGATSSSQLEATSSSQLEATSSIQLEQLSSAQLETISSAHLEARKALLASIQGTLTSTGCVRPTSAQLMPPPPPRPPTDATSSEAIDCRESSDHDAPENGDKRNLDA